jgi:hypothetical protein
MTIVLIMEKSGTASMKDTRRLSTEKCSATFFPLNIFVLYFHWQKYMTIILIKEKSGTRLMGKKWHW